MKIAVSACLLGTPCRYDGKSKPVEEVLALQKEHELIPICPEVLGGLPTPRIPSEVQKDGSVKNKNGENVTEAYRKGAEAVLKICKENGCKIAILKEKSPACGTNRIYDGTFSKTLIEQKGICAKLLEENGIFTFSEEDVKNGKFSEK